MGYWIWCKTGYRWRTLSQQTYSLTGIDRTGSRFINDKKDGNEEKEADQQGKKQKAKAMFS